MFVPLRSWLGCCHARPRHHVIVCPCNLLEFRHGQLLGERGAMVLPLLRWEALPSPPAHRLRLEIGPGKLLKFAAYEARAGTGRPTTPCQLQPPGHDAVDHATH